jgi:hypothetical protein
MGLVIQLSWNIFTIMQKKRYGLSLKNKTKKQDTNRHFDRLITLRNHKAPSIMKETNKQRMMPWQHASINMTLFCNNCKAVI